MKNKGFTLVELIATIAILGFVSLMAFPSINNVISSNKSSSCKYYERSMIAAAKSFIQKEKYDIIDAYNGTFPSSFDIDLTQLIIYGYLDEYKDSKTNINTGAKVVVKYDQSSNTYIYNISNLVCSSKSNNKELYCSDPSNHCTGGEAKKYLLPNNEETINFRDIPTNIFLQSYNNQLSLCTKTSDYRLKCYKNNNYNGYISELSSDSSCSNFGDFYQCEVRTGRCKIYKNGNVSCDDDYNRCSITLDKDGKTSGNCS